LGREAQGTSPGEVDRELSTGILKTKERPYQVSQPGVPRARRAHHGEATGDLRDRGARGIDSSLVHFTIRKSERGLVNTEIDLAQSIDP
jgi:hypothetical protein